MLVNSQEKYAELDKVIAANKGQGGAVMRTLQAAQDIFGHVPMDVQIKIAEGLDSTLAEVYGVATFYSQFRLQPVGKYLIMLCQGTACNVNGSQRIEAAITQELGISDGETTDDGLFTLKNVACLGCCSLSPVMMINGETYGSLTPSKTVEILRKLKEEG